VEIIHKQIEFTQIGAVGQCHHFKSMDAVVLFSGVSGTGELQHLHLKPDAMTFLGDLQR
jgi:hypothetical protein